jgi:hypothetical protein
VDVGRALLDKFVGELAAQREDHERRQFLAEYNRSQFARRQSIEATLRHSEAAVFEARSEVARLEQQLAGLQHWWHYFKRRALKLQLQPANMKSLLAVDWRRAAHEALGGPSRRFGIRCRHGGHHLCHRLCRFQRTA